MGISTDWITWNILVDYGNKTTLNRSADEDVFLATAILCKQKFNHTCMNIFFFCNGNYIRNTKGKKGKQFYTTTKRSES